MKEHTQIESAKKKIARVFRLARKQRGLSQMGLARDLGLQQSALSRIETGAQELGASQLVYIADLLNISTECFSTGFVETMEPSQVRFDQYEGGFKLPRKYARARGSKVRSTLPFLRYFEKNFGEHKLREYLLQKKLDPDFFYCLDNQISMNFSIDICKDMCTAGAIKSEDIGKIAQPVNMPVYHGQLHHQYDYALTRTALVSSLVSNARLYECNFNYEVSDEADSRLEIVATPENHLIENSMKLGQEEGHLTCLYKKSYLRHFSAYNGSPKAKVKEVDCYFKGAKRCVYQLELQA